MAKNAAVSKQKTAPKKRSSRHQFRSTYRMRAVHAFSESVAKLFAAHESNQSEKETVLIGLNLIASYRNIGHAIEMLCKEILESQSPYLTLEVLKPFDLLPFDEFPQDAHTCVAMTALGRASKFFKINVEPAELGILRKAIENRNACEHSHMKIKSIALAIKEVVPVLELFQKIYNRQFRKASLAADCNQISTDINHQFKQLTVENSTDFNKMLKRVEKERKKGREIVHCFNCTYLSAVVEKDGRTYKCEWCDDERINVKCTNLQCGLTAWVPRGTSFTCNFHTAIVLPPLQQVMLGDSFQNQILNAAGIAMNTKSLSWESILSNIGALSALDVITRAKKTDDEKN